MATAVENRGPVMPGRPSSSLTTDCLVSIREAEEIYGVSGALLYPLVRTGQLPAVRSGDGRRWSRVRVHVHDVEQLAAQLATKRAQQAERDAQALKAARAWPRYASPRGPSRNGRRGRTRDRLVARFGVPRSALEHAQAVVTAPDLVDRVQSGELTLARAHRVLRERERAA